MLTPLLKIAAPLTLLLALIFLAGAASAAVSLAGKAEANHCCEKEAEEQAPSAPGGECTDPGCGCLSCSASLLFQVPRISSVVSEYRPPLWPLTRSIPSAPGRSIDYPPELL